MENRNLGMGGMRDRIWVGDRNMGKGRVGMGHMGMGEVNICGGRGRKNERAMRKGKEFMVPGI
jgi:hypothetical protein